VTRKRALVLAVVAALAVALPGAARPALARAERTHGSAGIGDPYFPLDGNGGIDVSAYDIHDRYDFATGRLSGWTRVSLTVTQDLAGFDLDFLLPVRSVTIGGRATHFRRTAHELVIDHPARRGRTLDVVVRYAGRPSTRSYDGESNWLASDHEVVAMNEPHMAPWWFPSNDHPLDKASLAVSITVPKAARVVANGALAKRTVHGRTATTTWRAAPMVPYLAFFAAGRYAVAKSNPHGTPSYVAVSRALPTTNQRVAMDLMKRTPTLLHWLEGALGADYPFATTGGLTTGLSVGFALENQTRPTYPYLGDGAGAVLTVVHELAHQWFGDSVSLARWSDIWLNEGAATFMEDHYTETHGGETADRRLRTFYAERDADDAFWKLEVADPCPSHTGCVHRIFDSRVYQRGALALQALRNVIGDGAFWELLRTWVTTRDGGNGTTDQFQALAEAISGQDLAGFFDAWVHSTTKPADTAANGLG
jgi:aminopeptidase N